MLSAFPSFLATRSLFTVAYDGFPPLIPYPPLLAVLTLILALDSYNHLRNPRATKRLAADKRLALERRQGVAETGKRQEDTGDNERAGGGDARQEHDDGHDAVGAGAHVVCRDLADGVVEGLGGGADAQEEGDLDEEDHEGEDPVGRGLFG